MSAHRPKSPGWYPDPDILPTHQGVLRYWNGRHWTDRRRPMPILTSLDLQGPFGVPLPRVLEGPARTAELPAPAAEVSATRDAPAGRADPIDRSTNAVRGIDLPSATGGGGRTPPQPPGTGGGGGGGPEDGRVPDPAIRSRRRRKWWFFAAMAVVAAICVALIGQTLRPTSPGPRVLTDNHYVLLANQECARSLPGLRPPDGGPTGSAVTPVAVAAQIDTAAAGLDDLANRLATLPAADVDRAHIAAWLDVWHSYDGIGHQYATFLRAHGATGKAPPMLKTGAVLAKTVDNFARANGLHDCEFSFTYNPDPSQF